MRSHEDDADYHKVPTLGKHYSHKWAMEDMLDEQKEGEALCGFCGQRCHVRSARGWVGAGVEEEGTAPVRAQDEGQRGCSVTGGSRIWSEGVELLRASFNESTGQDRVTSLSPAKHTHVHTHSTHNTHTADQSIWRHW